MRKILIIITTEFYTYDGLTSVMLNYYRAMNMSGLRIDFASTNEVPRKLVDELEKNGSLYFCLGRRKRNPLRYVRKLSNVLKTEKYDVVHVNGNSATMCLELAEAKKCGVKMCIAHGHNSKSRYRVIGLIHRMLRPYLLQLCDYRLAVSEKAGEWLYGRDFAIINNAIDIDKYKFNEKIREKCRRQLNVEDWNVVIGHTGRLNEQKNHTFLLKVFAQVKISRPDVKLLLVGGGELEADLQAECRTLGIENEVIFKGMVDNPQDYMQAMDLFVFPSLYEGSPLALAEAQANGLPCLVSDAITMDVKFAENVIYKSLKDGVESWANEILPMMDKVCERNPNACEDVRAHGYDIKYEAEKLRNLYLQDTQGIG